MIGGNGWCGWPATGGGGVLTAWEQWIPASEFSLPPSYKNFRQQTWYDAAALMDQDTMIFPELTAAQSKILLHDDFNINTPAWNMELVWEEENGSHGPDVNWKAGVIVFESKKIINLAPNLAAVNTADGAASDDMIIITDLTTNLDIQSNPSPLTTPPFYCVPWIYRSSDSSSGETIVHGIRLRYALS